jgi:hypothetical protein
MSVGSFVISLFELAAVRSFKDSSTEADSEHSRPSRSGDFDLAPLELFVGVVTERSTGAGLVEDVSTSDLFLMPFKVTPLWIPSFRKLLLGLDSFTLSTGAEVS